MPWWGWFIAGAVAGGGVFYLGLVWYFSRGGGPYA